MDQQSIPEWCFESNNGKGKMSDPAVNDTEICFSWTDLFLSARKANMKEEKMSALLGGKTGRMILQFC